MCQGRTRESECARGERRSAAAATAGTSRSGGGVGGAPRGGDGRGDAARWGQTTGILNEIILLSPGQIHGPSHVAVFGRHRSAPQSPIIRL